MNISLEYFLAVAEEESISRAAERVMVSQQDMSNHIRRLEKQYGLLFERRQFPTGGRSPPPPRGGGPGPPGPKED